MPDQANLLTRPGSLAQVLRLVHDDGETLRYCLAGFLDEFYFDRDPASRRVRVEEVPALTGDKQQDALIGAIGEHLCHRWNLGAPPEWTNDPARFLDRPWFMGPERNEGIHAGRKPLCLSAPIHFHRSRAVASRQHAERRPLVGVRNDADGPRPAS
jgi:hypothetical protein